MSAANGIATPAATNATTPCWWNLGETNAVESQPESRTTATPTATEKTAAMIALVRTSGRVRPDSPRPIRIATRRTFATSIPNRVAVLAMNANCVVRVTTPNSAGPSPRVMITWVANVVSTPAARPITFCPAPPRMSRWSPKRPRGRTASIADPNRPLARGVRSAASVDTGRPSTSASAIASSSASERASFAAVGERSGRSSCSVMRPLCPTANPDRTRRKGWSGAGRR